MADELARSSEFPFDQRIAEAVSMGIPIEEIAQHFSDSKDKTHKLWLQQYKGLQVAERARERTGEPAESNQTSEQSMLSKAQKWAEENPITTAALATGAAGVAVGVGYAIKERIKSNAEIRKEKELAKIGIEYSRFNAIKLPNGAIGCSMSHLKCLQIAKERGWSHVFICEDDIQFLEPELFKTQLDTFLKNHKDDWDVLLVAGNNMPPYVPIDDTCVQVKQCQTTPGYIVKQHYYDTLIDNFKLII
jgi:uncharacterized protein YciI